MACVADAQSKGGNFINTAAVSSREFGNDKGWYLKNIPFFECSDKNIQQVYYYRWKLYKAHLKNLGAYGYIVTEFLNTMGWDLKPYNSLNDATSFHMYEGRWLKDQRYIRDYISYMYQHNGNDRHFSEAIADAAYAYYLVNPDKEFIKAQLASMVKIYNAWNDHYDTAKGLYYIEPLLDATEYTISSIDASGGRDGFGGGDSFRPSINSYMYANALAIQKIALLGNDTATARQFREKAANIKRIVQDSLWNTRFQHFTDRFKTTNKNVKYWDFIRGRELVGYLPWTYNLPDDNATYSTAWQHVLSADGLSGKYGLRTNEPSYQYYMRQYRYDRASGLRECQWNGPSWPFQTTQVLLGMANLLNNYHQHNITSKDYFKLFKQYTLQHFIKPGELNIVEDYDPDKGGPIVNLDQRSEHYNHSEYNDLIITGLCGLRPADGNSVTINPLIDRDSVTYFCLQNIAYRGHELSIVYDKTGKKYLHGTGLSVYVDGKAVIKNAPLKKQVINLSPVDIKIEPTPVDLAINLSGTGYPKASASYTDSTISNVNKAIDGRVWYFDNVRNYWTNNGSGNATDWYQVAFEKPVQIQQVALSFYANGGKFALPLNYRMLYWDGISWQELTTTHPQLAANTRTVVDFRAITTDKIKVIFTNAAAKYTALVEEEIY